MATIQDFDKLWHDSLRKRVEESRKENVNTCSHPCWHGNINGRPRCCQCGADSEDNTPIESTDVLTDVDAILNSTFSESLRRAEIQRIADDLTRKQRERGELL